jgi:hypothetical protein
VSPESGGEIGVWQPRSFPDMADSVKPLLWGNGVALPKAGL